MSHPDELKLSEQSLEEEIVMTLEDMGLMSSEIWDSCQVR